MDKFDKKIKEALANYEATYNASHWSGLEKKLGKSKSPLYRRLAGVAAIVVIAAGVYYFSSHNQSDDNTIVVNQVKTNFNNKIEKDNNSTVIVEESTNNKNKNQIDKLPNTSTQIATSNVTRNNADDKDLANQKADEIVNQKKSDYPINNGSEITKSNNSQIINSKIVQSQILVNDYSKCLNEVFEFRPSIPNQNVIYEWSLGDGTIIASENVNHQYKKAGSYEVSLTLKDRKTDEIIKVSDPVEITVLNVPLADFTFEFIEGVMPYYQFINTSENTSSKWEINSRLISESRNFEYTFKVKGNYLVTLTTTNNEGCSATTTKMISVNKDYTLLAPKAFSPNGDDLNDYFIPKALPVLNLPFTMLIYNRQGNIIFETKDINKPWDGTNFKDGVPASEGVYIWVVQLVKENGEIENYQGYVTITR